MSRKIKSAFLIAFVLISTIAIGQSSEIIKLGEKNACQYKSYYEDGSVKSIVGFYTQQHLNCENNYFCSMIHLDDQKRKELRQYNHVAYSGKLSEEQELDLTKEVSEYLYLSSKEVAAYILRWTEGYECTTLLTG